MSLLIKGTTSFLGLADTPASFAGEGLKNARVNIAEDAVEFGGVSGDLEILTEESQLLFSGAAPGAWTDLQIFDAVGNKPRGLCLLEFRCLVGADRFFFVRCNGETLDTRQYASQNANTNSAADNSRLGYAMVPCDDAGLIEWYASAAANVDVSLRAFIANVNWPGTFPTGLLIHSGAAPNVWTGISLGTGKALAIIRAKLNSVAVNRSCSFRRYGDTVSWPATPVPGQVTGISRAYCDQDMFSYAFVPTDNQGRIQWGDTVLNDWDVYLLGYITNVTLQDIEVYNATTPDQGIAGEFHTLDLPLYVQSLVVVKIAAGGGGIALRQTGLTAELTYDHSPGINNGGPTWTAYALQLTNEYGQVDVMSRALAANQLWLNLSMP
jgi:hypothetical protein